MTAHSLAQLADNRSRELPPLARHCLAGAASIQDAILDARSWPALSRICDEIDAAYRDSGIDLSAADELTVLVRHRAREGDVVG